jgi:2-polyprenyl-3-methyl-5-hydroxy-6-metoxy-1,4-benzoquinol methylase
MSTIQSDFDRIALASPDGSLHNDHYHNFLLRHLSANCERVLEIGCGKGEFSRRLAARAQHVTALDLSPEMIRLARAASASVSNIDFELADVMQRELPPSSFDCIASIATLHHLPLREILLKMKAALKPAGALLILDLFEPRGVLDTLLNPPAIALSVALRLLHHRRLFSSREARAAWAAHELHDLYPTLPEVRTLCSEILPGATVRKHLLWRYSVIWQKN